MWVDELAIKMACEKKIDTPKAEKAGPSRFKEIQ